jgi:hypothetical protein
MMEINSQLSRLPQSRLWSVRDVKLLLSGVLLLPLVVRVISKKASQ